MHFLISQGADLKATNNDSKTPLEFAIEMQSDGLELLRSLDTTSEEDTNRQENQPGGARIRKDGASYESRISYIGLDRYGHLQRPFRWDVPHG